MTTEELDKRIDELRYQLYDMDEIIRALMEEWYVKGRYIPLLQLHAVSVHISDLFEAFDSLSKIELSIIGDIEL